MPLCEPWASDADLCSPCNDYAFDSALMDDFFQMSSEVLYQLSGQQFPGTCEEVIRPCTRGAWNGIWRDAPLSHFPYRRWGLPVCGCPDDDSCSCTFMSKIALPHYPIISATVKLDGNTFTAFRIDDQKYLVRTDGERWPCCQDLSLPATDEDTWEVSYDWGREVPVAGRRAAGILACELYMACNPEQFEGQCRLPRNIVQIARQGVTVLVSSTSELFTTRTGQPAKFGIWEIDMFLRAFNPYGLTAPTVIITPDEAPVGKRVDT